MQYRKVDYQRQRKISIIRISTFGADSCLCAYI